MENLPQTLCIGSALWDTIARASDPLAPGGDVPGRIARQPGGVALNVAMALAARDVNVAILSAVGRDTDGDALLAATTTHGIDCRYVARGTYPTDNYLVLECQDGEVFGAVADCHSLEAAGDTVLSPLRDGRLGEASMPFGRTMIVDGNLSEATLRSFVDFRDSKAADCYFVPASPGKAARLKSCLQQVDGTLFANRIEAEILCGQSFADSKAAALGINALGAAAIITDSARAATYANGDQVISRTPPDVSVTSVTGAGDAFLAGFVAASIAGEGNAACLEAAIATAAAHISRDIS
ncbi:PfkB family carbohydrate kinase [Halovulum sp. GXIMD14793]